MKRIALMLFAIVIGGGVWAEISTSTDAEPDARSAKEIRGASPYVEIKTNRHRN